MSRRKGSKQISQVSIHDHLFYGKPTRRERAAYRLGWVYGKKDGANAVRRNIAKELEIEP